LDLRAIAKKSGRANDEYLRLYALEGFLLRLAASASSQDFVLKGGVLLAAYQLRRPTADIDFAALKMSNDVGAIKSMIITVADTQLPDDQDDGLWFDTSNTHAVAIRDEDAYSGVRVTLGAQLATAKMRFHVDVNVGDPIWPRPAKVQFPRLLGGNISLLGYPIPMVLAEKIVTASQRGITKHTMARLRRHLPAHRSTSPCRCRHTRCNQQGVDLSKRPDGPPSPCPGRLPRLSPSEVARLAHTAKP